MNWIDRKFARESNLVNGAPEVWQKVVIAIGDVFKSFTAKYERPTVHHFTEHNHAIRVNVELPCQPYPGMPDGIPRVNSVQIVFDEHQSTVSVTLNRNSPLEFPFASDEDECFITYRKEKVSVDKLTELALYDAFFEEPAAPSPQQYRPQNSGSNWR